MDDLEFDSVFDDDGQHSQSAASGTPSRENSPSGRNRQVSFDVSDSEGEEGGFESKSGRGRHGLPVSVPVGTGTRKVRSHSSSSSTSPTVIVKSLSPRTKVVDGGDTDDFSRSHDTSTLKQAGAHRLSPENFDLICVLGKGSYGKVVQAMHKLTKHVYALKILEKSHIESSTSDVDATKRERDILTMMNHPFIVKLHGAFQTPSKLYLLMDYVCGGELFHHINKQGIFMEEQARLYIAEIVLALEHLHSHGIIHRDLKPENILLGADGHVILTDFGLSKIGIKDGPGSTSHKTLCGTNEYMAPEMINGGGYGKSVDWWALGTLVYEMLTGDPPFHCRNTKKLFHLIKTKKISLPGYLTKDCHSLIRGLLNRNVDQRLGCAKHTTFKVGGVRQLKDHVFFAGLDWEAVEGKQIPAPFQLEFTSSLDVHYFDDEFTSEKIGSAGGSEVPSVAIAEKALHPIVPSGSPGGEPVTPGLFGGFSWVSSELETHVETHRAKQGRGRSNTSTSVPLDGVVEEEPPPELTEKQRKKLESKARRRAAWEAREKAKAEAEARGVEHIEEQPATTMPPPPTKNPELVSAHAAQNVGEVSSSAAMAASPAGASKDASTATPTLARSSSHTVADLGKPTHLAQAFQHPQQPREGGSKRAYRPPHPKHGDAAPAPAPVSMGGAWGKNSISRHSSAGSMLSRHSSLGSVGSSSGTQSPERQPVDHSAGASTTAKGLGVWDGAHSKRIAARPINGSPNSDLGGQITRHSRLRVRPTDPRGQRTVASPQSTSFAHNHSVCSNTQPSASRSPQGVPRNSGLGRTGAGSTPSSSWAALANGSGSPRQQATLKPTAKPWTPAWLRPTATQSTTRVLTMPPQARASASHQPKGRPSPDPRVSTSPVRTNPRSPGTATRTRTPPQGLWARIASKSPGR